MLLQIPSTSEELDSSLESCTTSLFGDLYAYRLDILNMMEKFTVRGRCTINISVIYVFTDWEHTHLSWLYLVINSCNESFFSKLYYNQFVYFKPFIVFLFINVFPVSLWSFSQLFLHSLIIDFKFWPRLVAALLRSLGRIEMSTSRLGALVYTILKGERPVDQLVMELNANMPWHKYSSHCLERSLAIQLIILFRDRFTTSVCLSF